MAKKPTSFSIDNALGRIAKPSVFDRIVKEIDPTEIPAKYIEKIVVQYNDGTIIELSGDEIAFPMPMTKSAQQASVEELFKTMRDVKVYVSTEQLEIDINELVEKYLGAYC